MFEQAILSGGPVSGRFWSTCAGVTGQIVVVGTMLLVPLVFPATLPQLQSYVTLVAPGPPPPPPPPPAPGTTVRPRGAVRTFDKAALRMPVAIPDRVAKIVEDPPEFTGVGVQWGVPGGIPGGPGDGIIGGVLSQTPTAPPPPVVVKTTTPAATSAPPPIKRYVQGGLVKLASPIRRVEPVYPQLARTARIEGVVELEGIIGIDGRIHDLKVKGGHPFLVQAAVEAVRQWLYSPGTLNGELVEVIAPITVTFRLGR
jgi:periplasmic protein TonB